MADAADDLGVSGPAKPGDRRLIDGVMHEHVGTTDTLMHENKQPEIHQVTPRSGGGNDFWKRVNKSQEPSA